MGKANPFIRLLSFVTTTTMAMRPAKQSDGKTAYSFQIDEQNMRWPVKQQTRISYSLLFPLSSYFWLWCFLRSLRLLFMDGEEDCLYSMCDTQKLLIFFFKFRLATYEIFVLGKKS